MKFKFNSEIPRFKIFEMRKINKNKKKFRKFPTQDLRIKESEKLDFTFPTLYLLLHVIKSYGLYGANAEKHSSTKVCGSGFHFGTRALVPSRLPQRSVAASTLQEEPSRGTSDSWHEYKRVECTV